MGFPTSYRMNAYVTPKSPKGWIKSDFCVKNKIQFQSRTLSGGRCPDGQCPVTVTLLLGKLSIRKQVAISHKRRRTETELLQTQMEVIWAYIKWTGITVDGVKRAFGAILTFPLYISKTIQ